jgi:hypothetical protein
MRRAGLILVVVVAVLVQVSLLPALRPLGVVPNLVLGLVALVGLEDTASLALAVAVAAGITLDVASGIPFGMWTVVLVLAALVTGLIHRAGLELAGGLVAGSIVVAGTIIMNLGVLLSVAPVVSHWPVGKILVQVGLQIALNLALVWALNPLVKWVSPGMTEEFGRVGGP